MEFVENDRADTFQGRVGLDHSRQNTFRDDFDTRFGGNLRFAPDAIADSATHRLAKGFRHASRCRASCEAAWLQHDDTAIRQACRVDSQRHPRRLAGAGWCLQYCLALAPKRLDQLRQGVVDG